MAFIDEQKIVIREVVEKRGRGIPHRPTSKMTGIILDSIAIPDFLNHLHIKLGSFFDSLFFNIFFYLPESQHTLFQLILNCLHRLSSFPGRLDVVAGRENGSSLDSSMDGSF